MQFPAISRVGPVVYRSSCYLTEGWHCYIYFCTIPLSIIIRLKQQFQNLLFTIAVHFYSTSLFEPPWLLFSALPAHLKGSTLWPPCLAVDTDQGPVVVDQSGSLNFPKRIFLNGNMSLLPTSQKEYLDSVAFPAPAFLWCKARGCLDWRNLHLFH